MDISDAEVAEASRRFGELVKEREKRAQSELCVCGGGGVLMSEKGGDKVIRVCVECGWVGGTWGRLMGLARGVPKVGVPHIRPGWVSGLELVQCKLPCDGRSAWTYVWNSCCGKFSARGWQEVHFLNRH